MKRCVQCGMLKEEETFRQYTYSKTNSTPGRYRICKSCEAINSAYRKALTVLAENKEMISYTGMDAQALTTAKATVSRTELLYKTLERRGLRVPKTVVGDVEAYKPAEVDKIDRLLQFYADPATPLTTTVEMPEAMLPKDLEYWLTVDTAEWREMSPEYLQETVYESLKAKYRPQTGVDSNTSLPIYDNTYKDVLNQILRRFDDYEEACSAELADSAE